MTITIDKITHTIAGAAIAAALLPWDAQGHGTPDRIDALVTVAGGAAMLGWLHLVVPLLS